MKGKSESSSNLSLLSIKSVTTNNATQELIHLPGNGKELGCRIYGSNFNSLNWIESDDTSPLYLDEGV